MWDNHHSSDKISEFLGSDKELDPKTYFTMLKQQPDSYSKLKIPQESSPHMLDIGCGVGEGTHELAKLTRGKGTITGFDLNKGNLDIAKKRAKELGLSITYDQGSADKLSYPDNQFSLVCTKRTLQHVPNPKAVLAEMARVTQSKGTLFIIEPDRASMILNAENRALTRTILHYIEDVVRHPWIGRKLLEHLRSLPVQTIRIQVIPISLTSFNEANQNFGLELAVSHLIKRSVISKTEGINWIKNLKKKDQNGHFFCSFSLYCAIAVKK